MRIKNTQTIQHDNNQMQDSDLEKSDLEKLAKNAVENYLNNKDTQTDNPTNMYDLILQEAVPDRPLLLEMIELNLRNQVLDKARERLSAPREFSFHYHSKNKKLDVDLGENDDQQNTPKKSK
jgi:DNA-binding protein Fis